MVPREAFQVRLTDSHHVHVGVLFRYLVQTLKHGLKVTPVLHRDDVGVVHDEQLYRGEEVARGGAGFLELRGKAWWGGCKGGRI